MVILAYYTQLYYCFDHKIMILSYIMEQFDLLNNDIKLLGKILGDVIKHHQDINVFNQIEQLRKFTKKNEIKKAYIYTQKSQNKELIAKAFSNFLNLSNIAESFHRVRRKRYYLTNKIDQRYSIDWLFNQNLNKNKLSRLLNELKIEFVLTAHPTEFKRRSLISNNQEIFNLLQNRDVYSEDELYNNLFTIVSRIWIIGDTNRVKPNPKEEARRSYHYISSSLYKVIPAKIKEIRRKAEKNDIYLPLNFMPFIISSWIGGDRDGNPFVTSKMTKEIILEQKEVLLELYKKDLTELNNELAMKINSSKLPNTKYPYRTLLESINPHNIEDSLNILTRIYETLINAKCSHIANDKVLDLIIKINCFKSYLMKLDLRQDSSYHEEVIKEISNNPSYSTSNIKDKVNFLKNIKINIPKNLSSDTKEFIELMNYIKDNQEYFSCYIISMTQDISDLMELKVLLNYFNITLPIVPLFETVEDLQVSTKTLSEWFKYNKEDSQMVMLGYSDSMKTGGKFSSLYNLYTAQEDIIKLGKKFNKKITFFHGRGGSIARGGGPIVDGILAQPKNSIQKHFRATIQGEMIDSLFSFSPIAARSLELYLSACILKELENKKVDINNKLCSSISKSSKKKYEEFLNHKDFIPFYKAVTPINEVSILKVGSRPSKRKETNKITDLRAIPWVFSWTQNRLLLPSWFGVGTSLNNQKLSDLKKEYKNSLFFKNFIELICMVLSKSKSNIFNLYFRELENHQEIKQMVQQEYELTLSMIKKIKNKDNILLENPSISKTIEARNPYVDPLNLLQIFALKEYREYKSYEELLTICFTGISNGLKNSG